MTDNRSFREIQAGVKPKVILGFKRIYVLAFNIYAWYWLYREIIIRGSTAWEEYLLWFFTTFGMYVFVLEHQEIFFKAKQRRLHTNR
jgi:hypothetical protein